MSQPPAEIDLALLDPILFEKAPGGRPQLLPVLLEAQRIYGHVPEAAAAAIGRAMRVPLAEIHGVLEFYSMLYAEPVGRRIVRVCTGPICERFGGEAVLAAAADRAGVRPGESSPDMAWRIEEATCLGLCDLAPAATVDETPVGPLDSEHPMTWMSAPVAGAPVHVGGDPQWLSSRCGRLIPGDVRSYEDDGGFRGLRRALLEMTPGQVIAEIKRSGLVGRGGAAFPTGAKWEMAASAVGEERFIVCNADESEPGTFKDRLLLEGDPLAVLEGMLIAGYAVGARRGYLYLRGEYARAREVLQTAIAAARSSGYLGPKIAGSGFAFDVELRSGAGAYICGEETALFEAIEGKRGFPRLKPPYPTTHGLFGAPTVINNVETLATAAFILSQGADLYRSVGTEKSPGSKLFCLSGDVAAPGVYEVPYGTKLGALLELAGGATGRLKAILLGGAAGTFAGPEALDLPMSFEGLQSAGLSLGSGVVAVFNEDHDLRRTLRSLARFFAHESCGKCFPCQLGTQRQLELIEGLVAGRAGPAEMQTLEDVGFAMSQASICGLGMTASTAILSAFRRWPTLASNGGA